MYHMKKVLLIIFSFSLFLSTNSYSQNSGKGVLPEGCSYTVISQPSKVTKNAQLVYGSNFRFPLLFADGNMVILTDDEVEEPFTFSMPEEIKCGENVFILGSLVICKSNTTIKSYDGKKVDNILILPDNQYNIYPANDGCFYLVRYATDSSSVYLFEVSTGVIRKLFDVPFIIDKIAGTGPASFVTANETIYFISTEICSIYEIADSKVQSIDFTSEGAFYSTEKACYYMGLPGKSYPFLFGDIQQLMVVDNCLYLLFSNGLLSVIDHIDQYQTFLEEVLDEVNNLKMK